MTVMASLMILATLLALSVGCTNTTTMKSLTPTEAQLMSVVISKRVLADSLTPAEKQQMISGLQAARAALETYSAAEVLLHLKEFVGPENADIADLIAALVRERVDVTQIPEIEGKAYVFAVLAGVERGLTTP